MTRMDRVGISDPVRLGRPLPLRLSVSLAAVRRAAAMAAVLISLSACWGLSGESRSPGGEQVLQSNLSVASAALAAGQPAIAQKLYLALAERFDDAPEPVLGLGYIALQTESPGEAGDYFRRAATLAVDAPGLRAEALLGAGRASLAQGDSGAARHHLSAARDLAEDSSTIAWIENGLAVAAVVEEDYRTAEAHYASALRQPAAHPRIAANFVRMLVASERIDEAERTYGAYAASYWEEGDRQALQSLIDGARRLPPLPDRPDSRLLLRLTGPEALPELATEAAYPAEDGLRSGLEGLVLTIGDRRFPAAPVTTATKPSAAAPAIQLPSEPSPGETVESVSATSGSIPEGLLAVRDLRSTQTKSPALATAPTGDVPSSSTPPSGSSSRSDVLVLHTDPAQATLERSPGVDAPAVGSRWATSTDERLWRDAGAYAGPMESAVPGMGRLRSGLMLVAPSSYSPDSSELHAPESGTAKDWPGTDRKLHESGTDLASGLSSITAGNEEWEHRFGPGPAQSANALLLTVSSDDAPSPPDDGSLWAPSLPDTAAYDSEADGATFEGARVVASAPATGSRSATLEDEDGVLQSEPSPTLVVNVAILNDYSNYDPFSAATASYRPFRLGSAVPQSDYALWDPVWMPQGGGSDPRTLILAAAQGHDDRLPQVADAAPPEPEPGDKWTVLLGTGQRLTLGVDAAAVAIASPDVADVQLLTPRLLFVMGRSLGRTTVSVLGEDGSVFERDVSVVLDLKPLRALLAGEPGLEGVQVEGLARGVALAGDVGSQDEVDRALGLVTASLPEGILIENNLDVGVDLEPLQALLASEPGLGDVGVRQVGRGVALTGEVASAEAADRAQGLAVASLPEGLPVENNLRVEFDIVPLRVLLAGEAGLERVQVRRLARGVALTGYVDSPAAAGRAMGLASASLPEGLPVENNLTVGLGLEPLRAFLAGEAGVDDLSPLRAFIAGEPGLDGVEVLRVGRGVALTGEVSSAEEADRAHRLAVAALTEGVPVENNLRVVFDIVPLRVLLAGEAGLERVQVQRLARGVALAGYVDSAAAEDRALRLAAASLPEGLVVENNMDVGLDLKPLRALLAGEPGLAGVEVRRVGRGVALTGAVASAEAADRAYRLAAASLPDSMPVENNLRVVFDVEPLRAVLAAESGLEGVDVRQLARGVALAGEVASPEAADRAYRLAAASLPEGLVVENNLEVGLDLEPLRALMWGEAGLEGVEVLRVGRGVALTGEVASADAADRAHRLAVAFLPDGLPVENNLRVQFDIEPLRTVLGAEPGLEGIRVQRLARGVALAGDIASPEVADRARRLAVASLPEGLLVENNLSVVLDLAPLHALMVGEPGLEDVEVRRVGEGVALTGEVESAEASDRAHRLAMASLPENLPVENNLRVVFDVGPLRAILAGEPELDRVQVQELGRGVVLTGEVASAEAFERAQRIATASLPEGVPVENSLRVVPDIEHLRAALAGEPGLDRVQVQRLARGVALSGDVDSPAAKDRALRLAAASLAEGIPVENNLNVGLDLAPLRSLVAGEPGLKDVRVERTGRGVALIGEVGSAEMTDQAARLAAALLPEDMAVETNLRVVWDIGPLRALLAGSPDMERVQVQRLARGVVLSGHVDSHATADLALRLAAASVPEGVLVENNLNVQLDLAPLRVFIAGEPDLRNVRVKRVGRGVALSGEVGSAEASDRAHRLAVASLPEGVAVENGLRVAPDVEPLRVLLAGQPGLERVHVRKLARGVALAGDVASPKAADRALRLAAASLPEGMVVENSLSVGLDLAPLETLMVAEEGFEDIRLNRIDRGVALTGEVGSQTEAERAARLAAASLPESALVENNLRVVLDSGPLRAALEGDPEFDRVRVHDLEYGVSLGGEVGSAAAAARAYRLAAVSLPADTPVENNLRIAGPLQVNLEVQIAEVQRSVAEDLGFNWEAFGNSGDPLGFGFRIGRPPGVGTALLERLGEVTDLVPAAIPLKVVDGLESPTLIAQRAWDNIGITGMVDALAKAGLANVLARPNVTANSGETASFFSGGEFPMPSGIKDGALTFEYKKYGVLLDFVPTIVDDGRVELTVRPEVSEPSQNNSVQVGGGVNVPVINVRRAETTVEMGDGESIVIAGLFSSASNEVQSGVPLLKDLPLLGAMFGHTSTRATEQELIVTVTARLVQAGPAPGEAGTAGSAQTNNSYYY